MPDLNVFINDVAEDKKEVAEELIIDSDVPVFGGTFQCQECDKEVNSAMFKAKEEKLTWTCPTGHVSSVPFK